MSREADPGDLAEELSGLFEGLDVAVLRFDADGRCTRANAAAGVLFGATLGASWIDLVHDEDRCVARAAHAEMADRGRATFEARARRGDGRSFDAEITLLSAASGHHQIVRDVSEERRRSARIEALRATLARRDRVFEELMSAAAHELHEPVRKVAAFAELLRDGSADRLDDTGRDYLDRIQRAAGRMERLLSDLRALTRVTTATLPFAPVDLGEAAQDALRDLDTAAREASLEASIGPLPTIEADAFQMTQLFTCLVGNVIRFRKPGEPAVLRIESGPASEAVARVTISDLGIGFEPAHAERIFRPFERLEGRSAREGSGLGLAVCRAIVERHGGTISAEGVPGHGATFTVTLPVRRSEAADASRS